MRILVALLVLGLAVVPADADNHGNATDGPEEEDMSPTVVSAIVLAAFVLVCFLLARYGP